MNFAFPQSFDGLIDEEEVCDSNVALAKRLQAARQNFEGDTLSGAAVRFCVGDT